MIAFVVERFGKPSETFIRRDLFELALGGADFFVYCLRRPEPGDAPIPEELTDRVIFAPRVISPMTALYKLRWFITHPVRFLSLLGMLAMVIRHPIRGWGELIGANRAFKLASVAAWRKVTRVHAQFATSPATVAQVAARLINRPFSISIHAWDVFVYRTMLRRKLAAADRIIACNDCARRHVVDKYGVPEDKALLVHHGLDLDDFSFEMARTQPPPLRIIAVGRLVPKKGFITLIEAVASLRKRGFSCQCLIVGGGRLESKLMKRIEKLKMTGSIELAGPADEFEVADSLVEAHVLVAPSVVTRSGNRDGIANVVLEAMARGTAVICTDAGGLTEVARHGETALVVPQNDADALAAAIRRIVEEPGLRGTLARAARSLVEAEFDVRKQAKEFAEALSA